MVSWRSGAAGSTTASVGYDRDRQLRIARLGREWGRGPGYPCFIQTKAWTPNLYAVRCWSGGRSRAGARGATGARQHERRSGVGHQHYGAHRDSGDLLKLLVLQEEQQVKLIANLPMSASTCVTRSSKRTFADADDVKLLSSSKPAEDQEFPRGLSSRQIPPNARWAWRLYPATKRIQAGRGRDFPDVSPLS